MQTHNPCNLFWRTNILTFLHFTYLFGNQNRPLRASLTHNGKHCPIESSLLPQRMGFSANLPGHCQNLFSPSSSPSSPLVQLPSNTSDLKTLYTTSGNQCIQLFTSSLTDSAFHSPTSRCQPLLSPLALLPLYRKSTCRDFESKYSVSMHACDCAGASAARLIADLTPQRTP